MPKIFVVVTRLDDGGVIAAAIAENGKGLIRVYLTGDLYMRRTMGLIGPVNHRPNEYSLHYPDGYTLVDYTNATDEELTGDPTYMQALNLNALEDEDAQGPLRPEEKEEWLATGFDDRAEWSR